MSERDRDIDYYFDWLYNAVCKDRFAPTITYRQLLMHLHNTVFRYSIRGDLNRAEDGKCLRERAGVRFVEPCSVLEMMVALAIRCENNIMDDTRYGDRTSQWFWEMIKSLGLNHMDDTNYNKDTVDDIIERFLERNYRPDGRGGLFTVRGCEYDLRNEEIWTQMCWYLNSIN